MSPVNTQNEFVVNQGDGIISIASRLEKNNLVKNKFIFIFYAYKMGLHSRLQAGDFQLSPSLSTPEIITKLSSGGTKDYWLKIIDGQRVEEITPKFPSSLEGYLFPDSYLIPVRYDQSQILDLIKQNFNKKFALALADATNTKMSDAEIVTFASILEREARTLPSKQMVAGILLNRLKIGMALQLDTTVEYARDSKLPHPKVYWSPATAADIHLVSSYNTYLNPGLPPAPICNPGTDSLYAAFHPTASDYLYYLTGNDNLMHYAKTLPDHNANVAKYLK